MSNRPPATYWERYTATDGTTANGSTAWPQGGGGAATLTGIATRGRLRLLGVLVETAGDFVSTPSQAPDGGTPEKLTIHGALGELPIVPQSIDPATTALPFVLLYGPLGPSAR